MNPTLPQFHPNSQIIPDHSIRNFFSSKERGEKVKSKKLKTKKDIGKKLFVPAPRVPGRNHDYTMRASATAPATSARTGRLESAAPGNWAGPVVWAGGDGGAEVVGLGGRGEGRETGGGM